MRINDYKIRHNTILKLKLTDVEKTKMLMGLLTDIERASRLRIPENKALKQENEEMRAFYREVLKSFS